MCTDLWSESPLDVDENSTVMSPLPSWSPGLKVDDLGEEILIFDGDRQLAFRLDGPTAVVFRSCGEACLFNELSKHLAQEFDCDGEALLLAALDELRRRALLQPDRSGLWQATRRRVLSTLAKSAVIMPTVPSSMV